MGSPGGGGMDGRWSCTFFRCLSRRIKVEVLELQPHSPGLGNREGFGAEPYLRIGRVQAAGEKVPCSPETTVAGMTGWGMGYRAQDIQLPERAAMLSDAP